MARGNGDVMKKTSGVGGLGMCEFLINFNNWYNNDHNNIIEKLSFRSLGSKWQDYP